MALIESQVNKWGNSLGIVIPKEIVDKEGIKENEKVRFLIVKDSRNVLKETFGLFKGKLKKPTQQIKDELRAELYD